MPGVKEIPAGVFASLNRDALCEIARLIDIRPPRHGNVIRKELQRDDIENRSEEPLFPRDANNEFRQGIDFQVVFIRDGDAGAGLVLNDASQRNIV